MGTKHTRVPPSLPSRLHARTLMHAPAVRQLCTSAVPPDACRRTPPLARRCHYCEGTGYLPCGHCIGSGIDPATRGPCSYCAGTSKVMCTGCLCTGKTMATEHDPRIDPFD